MTNEIMSGKVGINPWEVACVLTKGSGEVERRVQESACGLVTHSEQ